MRRLWPYFHVVVVPRKEFSLKKIILVSQLLEVPNMHESNIPLQCILNLKWSVIVWMYSWSNVIVSLKYYEKFQIFVIMKYSAFINVFLSYLLVNKLCVKPQTLSQVSAPRSYFITQNLLTLHNKKGRSCLVINCQNLGVRHNLVKESHSLVACSIIHRNRYP